MSISIYGTFKRCFVYFDRGNSRKADTSKEIRLLEVVFGGFLRDLRVRRRICLDISY